MVSEAEGDGEMMPWVLHALKVSEPVSGSWATPALMRATSSASRMLVKPLRSQSPHVA